MRARRRALLYGQLGRLIEAGLPLRGALQMLGRHQGQPYTRLAEAAAAALDRGSSLSEALGQSGLNLPQLDLELIEVGERSGRLPEVLGQLRAREEDRRKLRRELLQPVLYPCVLLLASILVTPAPSLVTGGAEAYLAAVAGPLLLLLLLGGALPLLAWLRPRALKGLLARVPGAGAGLRLLDGSAFLLALGSAIESGLGLPESLGAAARCAELPALRTFAERLHADALAGRLEPERIASAEHFGPFGSQVLAAAAETGALGPAALQSAQLLREDGLASVRHSIGLGAGVVYLAAAALVGTTVIRFYTQLYSMSGL
jgi:type II secretory pathway component PulF